MSGHRPFGVPAAWRYPALAAVVALAWLGLLSARPLFNPDEGRYAEIPREMLAGGDWVIPHLDGVAYIEKPPLQYWATALSLSVFGPTVFAARLYTALCALGTIGCVGFAAGRLWGPAAAWRACALLASLLLFVVLGQLLTLDMSLTFYMTVSLAGFVLAQRPRAAPLPALSRGPEGEFAATSAESATMHPRTATLPTTRWGDREPVAIAARQPETLSPAWPMERRWMLMAWAATALGVLTKGLVAALIPAAVLVLYSLAARDFAPWRRLHVGLGLPVFLVIAVPWHWLAARRLTDFVQFFFVHEHLARYLTPSADREEVWWFFAAVFVLGSIPWSASAVRVLATGWRRRAARGEFDVGLFLWLWVAFIGVFFSVSDSKLIPYILPAMPALALLIAASPAQTLRRETWGAAVLTLVAAGACGAASRFGPQFMAPGERSQYFALLATPLAGIAVLLAVSGACALLVGRRETTRAVILLSTGWCLAGLLLMRAAGVVAPVYSGVVLAQALARVPPEVPIYSVATYDQTLPFYWRRTLTLVAYRGELDFGLRRAPASEIPDVAQFVERWCTLAEAYAVMEISMFDTLQKQGVPMRELTRDVHRVLVARR